MLIYTQEDYGQVWRVQRAVGTTLALKFLSIVGKTHQFLVMKLVEIQFQLWILYFHLEKITEKMCFCWQVMEFTGLCAQVVVTMNVQKRRTVPVPLNQFQVLLHLLLISWKSCSSLVSSSFWWVLVLIFSFDVWCCL